MNSREYIKVVSSNTEDADIITVPNGEIWELTRWWGSANPNRDTHVSIVWDYDTANAEYVTLTYTSEQRNLIKQVTGNGTKKLAIVLANDDANSEALGAGFEYKVVS